MLRVLVVCTANVCRSPLAEALLREQVSGTALMFDSAGTSATPGVPADPRMIRFASSDGADMGGHVARRISDVSLHRRDLILTAERRHRRAVVQHDPRVSGRTFTLREFARLTSSVDLEPSLLDARELGDRERLDAVLSRLRQARPASLDSLVVDDDLADPHGRSDDEYEECARITREATEVVSAALRRIVRR